MKNVLVPTDFSPHAFAAAKYAAFLAGKSNWRLIVCHVYRPFYTGFQGELQNQRDQEQAKQQACSRMDEFVQRLEALAQGVHIRSVCLVGKVEEEIIKEAISTNAVLIIMGTQGAGFAANALLGSTTYKVIRKTLVPVVVVPKEIKRFELRRVGFATNFHAAEIASLYDFVQLMGDHVEVIPFHLYFTDRRDEEVRMAAWKGKASRMIAYRPLRFGLSRIRGYSSGIRNYIKKEKLDALAMTRINKRFFERLAGRSLVKAVVHDCPVPVIVFPQQ